MSGLGPRLDKLEAELGKPGRPPTFEEIVLQLAATERWLGAVGMSAAEALAAGLRPPGPDPVLAALTLEEYAGGEAPCPA